MSGRARPTALITGACGGMGRAVARAFGADHDLALTDIDGERLDAFADALAEEGGRIVVKAAGELAEAAFVTALMRRVDQAGALTALIHTAALSPAIADWEAILRANVIAPAHVLGGVEARLMPGLTVVLIASMAGYMAVADPEIDAVLAAPLAADFLPAMQPHLARLSAEDDAHALATPAYLLSKREMLRQCERRAPAWGRHGARIVSISPGMIWTPMGRREAESNPKSAAVLDATPLARWGTPADIANAARFLCSPQAAFITGCDLRVDGGVTPAVMGLR